MVVFVSYVHGCDGPIRVGKAPPRDVFVGMTKIVATEILDRFGPRRSDALVLVPGDAAYDSFAFTIKNGFDYRSKRGKITQGRS